MPHIPGHVLTEGEIEFQRLMGGGAAPTQSEGQSEFQTLTQQRPAQGAPGVIRRSLGQLGTQLSTNPILKPFVTAGQAVLENVLPPIGRGLTLAFDPFAEALAAETERVTASYNIIAAERALGSTDAVQSMRAAELLPQFRLDLQKADATRQLEKEFVTGTGDLSGPELAGQLRSQFQERPLSEQLFFGLTADPIGLLPVGAAIKGTRAGIRGIRGAQQTRRLREVSNIPAPAQAVARDISTIADITPPQQITRSPIGGVEAVSTTRPETGLAPVFREPSVAPRSLPARPSKNFVTDLSDYTDVLYHETGLDNADIFIPGSQTTTEIGTINLANTPNFAQGQGGQGILLEFDSSGIQGVINSGKPGLDAAYQQGEVELLSRFTRQNVFQGNLRAIRIRKDATGAQHNKIRLNLNLDKLQDQGWIRREFDDFIELRRPDLASPERPLSPAEVPARTIADPKPPTTSEKLISFVETAKPLREDAAELKRVELGKRVSVGRVLRESESDPLMRARRFKSALAGELPAPHDFEPPINQITDAEHAELFDTVNDFFKRRRTQQEDFLLLDTEEALEKVLNGVVPQPKELAKLEAVFGPGMTKALRGQRPLGRKIREEALDLINLPRALKTAFDVSAPLRQGLMLGVGHPIRFFQANISMFKAFAKESNAVAVTKYIKEHPNVGASQESGLFLAERIGNTGSLNVAEEAFMSRWAEKIPGLKQSSRAYSTFLNKLRYDVWNDQYQRWVAQGFEGKELFERSRQWADFINKATGRGPLGPLEKYAGVMNAAFFAPRLFTSRVTLPFTLATHSKVRGLIAKDLAAAAASVGTVISLLNLTDAVDVEADPRSSDFGKIRVGPTRVDVMAGFQPIIRYATQIGLGQTKSTGTGRIRDISSVQDRAKIIGRFMRSKLSPPAAAIADVAFGSTFIGEETTATRLGLGLFEPLSEQDIREGYQENGLIGAVISATSLLGTSVVSYQTVNDAAEDNFGVGYQELWPYERNVARGLWQLTRATEPTGVFARMEKLDLDQQQDLADIAEGFLRNPDRSIRRRLNMRGRVNAYFDIVSTYANLRREAALAAFGERQAGEEFTPSSPDPLKRALGQYFVALDEAKVSEALFDSDGFNRAVAMLERQWTRAQREYVAANTHQTDVPPNLLRILPSRTRRRIRQSQQARDRHDTVRESNSP